MSDRMLPAGLEIVTAATFDGPELYLKTPHYTKTDTGEVLLGPWSMNEAGDLAWTLLQAVPHAIAAQLEHSMNEAIDALSDRLEARLETPDAE